MECSVCGGPIAANNTYGICSKTAECLLARKRLTYANDSSKVKAQQKRSYEKNKDKRKAEARAWRTANIEHVKKKDQERKAKMLENFRQLKIQKAVEQNFLCPCGEPLGDDMSLDHDHNCCDKHVMISCRKCDRQVMHARCNSIIGFVGENPERLFNLTEYLRSFPGK